MVKLHVVFLFRKVLEVCKLPTRLPSQLQIEVQLLGQVQCSKSYPASRTLLFSDEECIFEALFDDKWKSAQSVRSFLKEESITVVLNQVLHSNEGGTRVPIARWSSSVWDTLFEGGSFDSARVNYDTVETMIQEDPGRKGLLPPALLHMCVTTFCFNQSAVAFQTGATQAATDDTSTQDSQAPPRQFSTAWKATSSGGIVSSSRQSTLGISAASAMPAPAPAHDVHPRISDMAAPDELAGRRNIASSPHRVIAENRVTAPPESLVGTRLHPHEGSSVEKGSGSAGPVVVDSHTAKVAKTASQPRPETSDKGWWLTTDGETIKPCANEIEGSSSESGLRSKPSKGKKKKKKKGAKTACTCKCSKCSGSTTMTTASEKKGKKKGKKAYPAGTSPKTAATIERYLGRPSIFASKRIRRDGAPMCHCHGHCAPAWSASECKKKMIRRDYSRFNPKSAVRPTTRFHVHHWCDPSEHTQGKRGTNINDWNYERSAAKLRKHTHKQVHDIHRHIDRMVDKYSCDKTGHGLDSDSDDDTGRSQSESTPRNFPSNYGLTPVSTLEREPFLSGGGASPDHGKEGVVADFEKKHAKTYAQHDIPDPKVPPRRPAVYNPDDRHQDALRRVMEQQDHEARLKGEDGQEDARSRYEALIADARDSLWSRMRSELDRMYPHAAPSHVLADIRDDIEMRAVNEGIRRGIYDTDYPGDFTDEHEARVTSSPSFISYTRKIPREAVDNLTATYTTSTKGYNSNYVHYSGYLDSMPWKSGEELA